jgi:hypothetical protein
MILKTRNKFVVGHARGEYLYVETSLKRKNECRNGFKQKCLTTIKTLMRKQNNNLLERHYRSAPPKL